MNKWKSCGGFSFIELVIVILLVGIVSVVAISRMLNADAFNALIAREAIISASRVAQQKAVGHKDVVLTLQPQGDSLDLIVEMGLDSQEIHRVSVSTRSLTLSGDINELASCSVVEAADSITESSPMVVEFDSLGNLRRGGVDGSVGFPASIQTGVRVCVNDNPDMSVCFSPSGFAYAGSCDG